MDERNRVSLIPVSFDFDPGEAAVDALRLRLLEDRVLAPSPEGGDIWMSGAEIGRLIDDPGLPPSAGAFAVRFLRHGRLVGLAGRNLEPTECPTCGSEMPWDGNFDGIAAVNAGEACGQGLRNVQCLHCETSTDVTRMDFRRSGGFCRFEVALFGKTSGRVSARDDYLGTLSGVLGTPLRYVHISEA